MFERVNLLLDLSANSSIDFISDLENTKTRSMKIQKSKDINGVEIVLNDLSFVFRNSSTQILEKVSFTIETGSVVALVGNSGSGKTTITEIILGLLKQTSGDIYFDGERSEKWLSASSNRVSYVPQDPSMNWDSIAQNVALEQDFSCIDLDSVKKALSYVGFESNFELGESVPNLNIKLSGGQKQRLSIARAIYHESKLLIVDEATSSLDGLSEEVITDYLIANPLRQTIIIIAHRLSSIKKVDNIFVLSEGKIKTSGNYKDLLINSPEFTQQAKSLGLL
jgi:ABC-type bacteriocin/lantibiotic exporter with double-glycine peptidase domain